MRSIRFDQGAASNVIEVYVSRLRRKFGRDAIRTVRGLRLSLGSRRRSCAMTGRSRTRRGSGLRLPGASSLMSRLARSIMLGLALLWLTGRDRQRGRAAAPGRRQVRRRAAGNGADPRVLHQPDAGPRGHRERAGGCTGPGRGVPPHDRFAYRVVDDAGRILLRSSNAPAFAVPTPLREGLVDADGWRVATLRDPPTTVTCRSPTRWRSAARRCSPRCCG